MDCRKFICMQNTLISDTRRMFLSMEASVNLTVLQQMVSVVVDVMKKTGAIAKSYQFCHSYRKLTALEQSAAVTYFLLHHLKNVKMLCFFLSFLLCKIFYQAT